jgi:subfamily B ATP-binding cassette protein MsbA
MMIKDIVANPVTVVIYLVLLLLTSWKLTLFALLAVPFMAGSIQLLSRRIRALSSDTQGKMADVASLMEETISNVRVVKAFTAEDYEIRRFERENESALEVSMRGVRRSARLKPTIDFIGAMGIALALWIGGSEVARGQMDFGQLIRFILLVVQLANAVGAVGNLRVAWEEMMGAADRIFGDVLDVVPEIRNAPDAKPLPPVEGKVEFRNVSFNYDRGVPALTDVNLTLEPGKIVALVGPTGAGKSTLADMVPRFYDPQSGTVLVDGQDIRTVTIESLRSQIGIVPQDTVLFSGTLRDNIAYGRRDATDEEIIAAARAANADSFIQSFPLQYQTVIGERGATLSGGEKQRIAIARALLANPRILILDEATSALDAATEALVQEALETLMKGRTTLIIAHRLSTIVNADTIVVLRKGGRIAEQGSHSELLALGGIYAALYETQQRTAELSAATES